MERSIGRAVCANVAGLALVFFAMQGKSDAATLVLDNVTPVTTPVTTPVDLTATGGVDWAYWSAQITPAQVVAATNDKSGGTAINALTTVGGGNVRGTVNAVTVEKYSFTNGTTTTSASNVTLGGLAFNDQTGTAAAGKGVSLNITGDMTQEQVVTLYLGGFGATGNLLVTLNGATSIVNSTQVYTGAPKAISIFTLRFRPDLNTDILNIQFTASSITDAVSGHVGIEAITIVAVPEPSAFALGLVGMLILFRRRRKVVAAAY